MENKEVLNRWHGGGVSALLALGLLAGCSNGEPEPTFAPSRLDSTPSSDSNSEPDVDFDPVNELEPPEMPVELSENTVEGAEAAARFYIDALNYGYATLDSDPLQEISLNYCGTCQLHVSSIEEMRDLGRKMIGGEIDMEEDLELYHEDDRYLFSFSITQDALEVQDEDGNLISERVLTPGTANIITKFTETGWRVYATSNEVDEA